MFVFRVLTFIVFTLVMQTILKTVHADAENETNFIDNSPLGATSSSSLSSSSAAVNEDYTHYADNTRSQSSMIQSDDYVSQNQKRCFETRSLMSCIKYKAAKFLWKHATNSWGYFPYEYSRELREDKRRFRLIQLGVPTDVVIFNDVRSFEGDGEFTKIFKFLKRAAETFGRNHGLQVMLSSDTGARISGTDIEGRGRHDRKKKKWLIILPLIILMKLAHLKMTLVTLLLGVLGMNVLLVGGTGWLIHYLKFKTLCKIHPHLVQSHSHVYDSDPTDYSQFVGSSFPGSYYSAASSSPHEVGINGYSKDWGTSKAYSGYNYLDTISKRLE